MQQLCTGDYSCKAVCLACMLLVWCWLCLFAVRDEAGGGGYAVNSIKEPTNDSELLNHSNDSVGSAGEVAEFSDEEDVPAAGKFQPVHTLK